MVRTLALLALCGLAVAAGCLGGVGGPSATPSPSTLTGEYVGDRAIAAEQTRIEQKADEYETLTGLGFGVLVPAEYEVLRRNGTGVVVRVTVGYSLETDCDADGEPESSADGATTEATYFVTGERVRLLEASDDFVPERYC